MIWKGSLKALGQSITLSDFYYFNLDIFETNPNTSELTKKLVNG